MNSFNPAKQLNLVAKQILIEYEADTLDTSVGICTLVDRGIKHLEGEQWGDVINLMRGLFRTWDKFSGHGGYPICVGKGTNPVLQFAYHQWKGSYWLLAQGVHRLDLVKHIIKETEGKANV